MHVPWYIHVSLSHSLDQSLENIFTHSRIVDLGVTDHLTHSPYSFLPYSPCPNNRKIATADGSLITITRIRDVKLNHSLILKDALNILTLSTNLISIRKLTHDSKCSVIFNQTLCIFLDKIKK